MKPKNGAASAPPLRLVLTDRLADYETILKRLDVVLGELELDGLVAMDVRDKFERLIISERLRVSNLARTVRREIPSPSPALPSITKPNGSEKTAKNSGTGSGTQSGTVFSRP